ncbi:MAG: glucokinase [Gammaproteobacteria bacterium]|nr:glucokinase [Gammaproteobacteria bacterium]
MRVLAGDIGGTKTLLEVADVAPGAHRVLAQGRYLSNAYDSLLPMIREFIGTAGAGKMSALHGACFGVAGPITNGGAGQCARLTNLPWEVDTAVLAHGLGIGRVRLINDFQAVGYGIEVLEPGDLAVLQEGHEISLAPRAVIGAGTGLGVGILVWQNDHYEALPTEGGHADFAPTSVLQVDLLRNLMGRFGRVSYERLLSGPGLVNIYSFLSAGAGESAEMKAVMEAQDPAAAIAGAARERHQPVAVRALQVFAEIYGAQAGNLALTCLARGGVYLAGGIAPKIIATLREPAFLRAFNDKGRMSELTAAMPVRVVMNPGVGLIGAALAASRL